MYTEKSLILNQSVHLPTVKVRPLSPSQPDATQKRKTQLKKVKPRPPNPESTKYYTTTVAGKIYIWGTELRDELFISGRQLAAPLIFCNQCDAQTWINKLKSAAKWGKKLNNSMIHRHTLSQRRRASRHQSCVTDKWIKYCWMNMLSQIRGTKSVFDATQLWLM